MKKILFFMVACVMTLATSSSASAQITVEAQYLANVVVAEGDSVYLADAFVGDSIAYYLANAIVVDTIGADDFQACKAWLEENPGKQLLIQSPAVVVVGDSITAQYFAEGDTVSNAAFLIYKGEDGRVKRQPLLMVEEIVQGSPLTVQDFEISSKIEEKATDKQTEYRLKSRGDERDDVWNYKTSTGENIPKKWRKKDGWSITLEGNYRLAKEIHAFSGMAGPSYTGKFYRAELLAGPSRNVFSQNAQRSGEKYWGFNSRWSFYIQPLKFDHCDQWRLWLGGGVGFDYFKTDSQPTEDGSLLKSKGNYLYAHVGGQISYRFFCKPLELAAGVSYLPEALVIQNHGESRGDGWVFFARVMINLAR